VARIAGDEHDLFLAFGGDRERGQCRAEQRYGQREAEMAIEFHPRNLRVGEQGERWWVLHAGLGAGGTLLANRSFAEATTYA
jgi:hypothetical protein